MAAQEYYKLPVNYEIGFPQTVFTSIHGQFFAFTYRFNSHDGGLILIWTRASDGAIIFQGKMAKDYEHTIKDPSYGIPMVVLVASEVEQKNVEVLMWAPWLS